MELTVKELCRHYGGTQALDHISFTLGRGVYGLLGPNGAGKSTLMRILGLYDTNYTGEVLWDDVPLASCTEKYRSGLGVMPQQQALYPTFTAWEFLLYMAALKGMGRADAEEGSAQLLDAVGLSENAHQRVGTFSGGMKQRLGLAQALLGHPQMLILDEPTAGLDPYQRIAVRNLIAALAGECCVLIATHVVQDVDTIADEILLLRAGSLLQRGTPAHLCAALDGHVFTMESQAAQPDWIVSGRFRRADGTAMMRVIAAVPPTDCRAAPADPTLEDVYLAAVGNGEMRL